MRYVDCLALLVVLSGCVSSPREKDRLQLYNDIINQIINERYYQHCLILDDNTDKIQAAFQAGKRDRVTYIKIGDSLKASRRRIFPKCVLDFASEFQVSATDHRLSDDIKQSIAKGLEGTFVKVNFEKELPEAIVDRLSEIAQLEAKDLSVSYLEIIPHERKIHRPYGEGMGVICFSRVCFNSKMDKAILFYEFECGPKCGTGELVFVQKVNGKWEVIKYNQIWIS